MNKLKYKVLFILMMCFSMIINAQVKLSVEKMSEIMARVDSLYDQFNNYQNLGNEENAKSEFLKLFEARATIHDDLNLPFMTNEKTDLFKTSKRPTEEYIKMISENYSSLRIAIINSSVNYDNLESRKLDLTLVRRIEGFSGKFQLEIFDTIVLNLSISPNFDLLLISSIDLKGFDINLLNDKDKDLIIDKEDKCPEIFGDIDYKGCPAPWGPSLFVGGHVSVGAASGNIYGMSLSTLGNGLNNFIEQDSRLGNIQNLSTPFTFTVGGNLDYFAWRKRRLGISVGFAYTYLGYETSLDRMRLIYQSSDDWGDYKRILTFDSKSIDNLNKPLVEKLKFHFFDIPVLIKWKPHFSEKSKKWQLGFNTGFISRIFLKGTSDATGDFDFEGVYHFENGLSTFNPNYNKADYFGGRNLSNAKILSEEQIQQNLINDYNNGMDVGLNKTFNTKSTFTLNNATSFVLNPVMYKKIDKRTLLSLGLLMVFSTYDINYNENYKYDDQIRNLGQNYTSLINGNRYIQSSSFTFQAGILYGINKPYFK